MFSEFQKPKEFSLALVSSEKIASEGDSEKVAETTENKGVPAICEPPAPAQFGSKTKSSGSKKIKAAGLQKKSAPKVAATGGPDGYKHDCEAMTATQLRLAYGGEYTSWRNSKSRCNKKHWPWAAEWDAFKGFLLSMGPKPSPAHTLDRIDNAVLAYGPDLCRWADKVTQNNNKGNNHKIVVPLTGEVLSVPKLMKLHSVKAKTVYKWFAGGYCVLELLAGKKSKSLHAVSVALDEFAASQPPKGKKPPAKKIKVPDWVPPPNEWNPTPEQYDHYIETGEMQDNLCQEMRAEYDAVVAWVNGYNAGLEVPPEPPQGKYYKFSNPANRHAPAAQVPIMMPHEVVSDHPTPQDDEDDFDPADDTAKEHWDYEE
jgi:hypothetical protein